MGCKVSKTEPQLSSSVNERRNSLIDRSKSNIDQMRYQHPRYKNESIQRSTPRLTTREIIERLQEQRILTIELQKTLGIINNTNKSPKLAPMFPKCVRDGTNESIVDLEKSLKNSEDRKRSQNLNKSGVIEKLKTNVDSSRICKSTRNALVFGESAHLFQIKSPETIKRSLCLPDSISPTVYISKASRTSSRYHIDPFKKRRKSQANLHCMENREILKISRASVQASLLKPRAKIIHSKTLSGKLCKDDVNPSSGVIFNSPNLRTVGNSNNESFTPRVSRAYNILGERKKRLKLNELLGR